MPHSTPPHQPRATRPASQQLPDDVQRALALRDVMQQAVAVETGAAAASRRPRSHTALALALLCVPLLAFSLYSFVARPEAIWGPRPEKRAPERVEADARLAMFFVAQRLNEYRRQNGEYPAGLAELGLGGAGISYVVLGDTAFELRGGSGAAPLVLRSTDDWDDFLRPSAALIAGGRK